MASFEFNYEEAFAEQIASLGNFDELAPKIIEESIPILTKNVVDECRKHVLTSEMVNSVKKTKVKKGKNGWYSVVRPTGVDSKGVRNMEKIVALEYGTSKQSPSPVLSVAISNSKEPIANLMQEIYNKEVDK